MKSGTRIVASYGPACNGTDRVAQLLQAGVDIMRINCSHGTPDNHLAAVAEIRQAAIVTGRNVSVLADLPGPKLRLGDLAIPVQMSPGEVVVLAPIQLAGPGTIPVHYPHLAEDVRVGGRILLRDGLVDLEIRAIHDGIVTATVTRGGVVGSRHGVSLPQAAVRMTTPTGSDLAHAARLLTAGADYLALSFVRSAEEVHSFREWVNTLGRGTQIIAKIEHPDAVRDLDAIIRAADGVMVARGDLGVEIGLESVPLVQKKIIKAANRRGVPVITATELLDSMVHSSRPTRAEASDVVNAVLDGTDAVMLSAETAAGEHPVEAVRVLHRLCQAGEVGRNATLRRRLTHGTSPALIERTRESLLISGAVAVATFDDQVAHALAMAGMEVPIVLCTQSTTDAGRHALFPGLRVAIVDQGRHGDLLRSACAGVQAIKSVAAGDQIVVASIEADPTIVSIDAPRTNPITVAA